jgi:hypothetical protein
MISKGEGVEQGEASSSAFLQVTGLPNHLETKATRRTLRPITQAVQTPALRSSRPYSGIWMHQ